MSALAALAAPIGSPDWYEERQTYIGASDAAAILGIDPWRSQYELWLEKTGQKEPEAGTAITRWGQRVEQVAAEIYAEETGRRLRRFGRMVRGQFIPRVVRHPKYPFIAANPDRGVIGEKRLVQVKSSWREWAEVPDRVQLQLQQEMAVTGAEGDDVALLTGFAGFKRYENPRNESMIANLIDIERAWWDRHVVRGEEPPRSGRYLDAMRGVDTMIASSEQSEAAKAIRELNEAITQLEARRDNAKDWLKRSMAGALVLNGSDYGFKATWKPTKDRTETDWHAIAGAYRLLLQAQIEDVELPEWLIALGGARMRPGMWDAIESVHTATKPGSRPMRITWKDVEPTSEEEN